MSIELMKRALEFITGVYFGEHEGSRADREKLEADLTTAIQQAEAQQPTEQDEQEADGLPPIVARAIFDFAGFMTTRSEVIEVGSTADAAPVANLVKEWAESRGLDLANAAVLSWQLHITRASLPTTSEPVDFPAGAIVNGRTLMDRIEAYPFESEGGDLRMCSDWHELRRCFEHLADYVSPRPAPSVPDDVARDAERYRFIRDADVSDDLIPDIALYAMESLDEYIDAAMLAAK